MSPPLKKLCAPGPALFAAAGLLLALAVSPALITLAGAFRRGGAWTVGPVVELLSLHRFLPLLARSLLYAATASLVAVVLGTVAALIVTKFRTPLRPVLLFLAVFGIMLPPFVTAGGWRQLLGTMAAPGATLAGGLILGLTLTPWAILLAGMGLAAVDSELEEVALLEGTPLRVVLRVTLPQAGWSLAAALAVTFILALSDTAISGLLSIRTFGEEVYSQYQMARPSVAAATAVPVLLLCLGTVGAARRPIRTVVSGLDHLRRYGTLRFRVGRASGWLLAGVGLLCACVLAAPLVDLVRATGSLHTFTRTVEGALGQIGRSALLGLCGAFLCVLTAVPLSYGATKCKMVARASTASVLLLIGVPAPVIGIGLIRMFDRPGWAATVYDSSLITLLAVFCRALPFCLIIVLFALRTVPASQDEQARIDGAGEVRRLWFVYVPNAWPGLLVAFLMSYVLCVSEVSAAALVIPPGRDLLSTHILNLAHYGVYANLAALSLAMIFMVLPVAACAYILRGSLLRPARR